MFRQYENNLENGLKKERDYKMQNWKGHIYYSLDIEKTDRRPNQNKKHPTTLYKCNAGGRDKTKESEY